ncbi:MAG: hypothetical protein COS89_07695 [Deltaproteobacteria bacterium CG07_land_8_20_14_0_80_38_7]|nr:MAG: hypothetical protein COS89_07695 [Deltaproteobacteria bacterium CG07_land_8_20_14_0_80_38_7]
MKTIISGRHIITEVTDSDETLLTKFIELFAPLIQLPRIGLYSKMDPEEVWQRLVSQVCVTGSARHMERLEGDAIKKKYMTHSDYGRLFPLTSMSFSTPSMTA